LMLLSFNEGGVKWVIGSIYNREDWKELERRLMGYLEGTEDREISVVIIGGDFNIRKKGELGKIEEAGIERRSKDKTIGNGGRNLMDWIHNRG